ncbi:MAG TPA: hypothetical protein VIS72_09930 [Anaerolineales bacterium]
MNYLILALRLIHIVCGIFWVGAALLLNFFVAPTLRATGEAGRPFIGHFMARTRFSTIMSVSVFATLIAGFWLYGIDSRWFQSPWMSSSTGIGFGIGALFAVVGMVTGLMNGSNNTKMAQLGVQIQGKPTPEQMAAMSAIQKQQAWVVPVNSSTLLISAFFMAVSRYLVF